MDTREPRQQQILLDVERSLQQLGAEAMKDGRYDEAAALLEQARRVRESLAVADGPGQGVNAVDGDQRPPIPPSDLSVDDYTRLVKKWAEAGDADESLRWCQEGRRHYPDHAVLLLAVGQSHTKCGRLVEALDTFQEALDRGDVLNFEGTSGSEACRRAHRNLAEIRTKMGMPADAEQHWRHLVSESGLDNFDLPVDASVIEGLVDSLLRQGKYKAARAEADRLAGDERFGFIGLVMRAYVVKAREGLSAAVKWLRSVGREDPRDPKPLLALVRFFFDHGNRSDAEPVLEKLVEIDPLNAEVFTTLGIIYRGSGRYDEAIETLGKSLELRPEHASTQYLLGLCFRDQDRLDEAEKPLEEAHRLAPENSEYKATLNDVRGHLLQRLLAERKAGTDRAIQTDAADRPSGAAVDSAAPAGEATSRDAMLPGVGDSFEDYELLRRMENYGAGTVYKAIQRRADRYVVLKFFPDLDPSLQLDALQRVAQLYHPNVLSCFAGGEAFGGTYVGVEFLEGSDLEHVVNTRGPLSVEAACDCIRQAASGLSRAHEGAASFGDKNEILPIYQQLSPGNLLLGNDGLVKIIDLGIPTAVDPDYAAPEAPGGGPRSDVYSLGCILYFLLTGMSLSAARMSDKEDILLSLRALRPEVPYALGDILRQMLAEAPERRFSSMSEVVDALNTLVSG